MALPPYPPDPNFLGDHIGYVQPTWKPPTFMCKSEIMRRWDMGAKMLGTLINRGVIRPKIQHGNLMLFLTTDIMLIERDGWVGHADLPPPEAFPPGKDNPIN